MTTRNFIFFLSIILTSCSYSDKDFKLTSDEMKFLNAYKKGDTIWFESSLKQTDKILIIGLDSNQKRQSGYIMAKPAYNEMFISIKHLSADKDNKIDTANESLITISKYPQQTKTNYFISYRHFLFSSDNGLGNLYSDTLFVNNKPITNYYKLRPDYFERDTTMTDFKEVYWTQNEGLVGYKLNNGVTWTKKKLQATLGLALLGLDEYCLSICSLLCFSFGQDVINLAYE